MAEAPGFLYKSSSSSLSQGVIGKKCVKWEEPPAPPPRPDPEPEDPPETKPPDEGTTTTCPEMTTVYFWDDGGSSALELGREAGCYAMKTPVDPNINGWPAVCGGYSRYKVDDSYCGR